MDAIVIVSIIIISGIFLFFGWLVLKLYLTDDSVNDEPLLNPNNIIYEPSVNSYYNMM